MDETLIARLEQRARVEDPDHYDLTDASGPPELTWDEMRDLSALLREAAAALRGGGAEGEHPAPPRPSELANQRALLRVIEQQDMALQRLRASVPVVPPSPPVPDASDLAAVPGWFQVRAGSDLDRLVEIVRLTYATQVMYTHTPYQAAGLIWRWALQWFTPKVEPPVPDAGAQEKPR